VVVEGVELDLGARGLHDLVNLAVLLAADKVSVLVRQLDVKADLVVEVLCNTVSFRCCENTTKQYAPE